MAKNVTAPRKWKSSPDHPQAQLAYVTQPEIDMLVDANIYGSMDGKPNRGPKGIISLQGDITSSYEPPSGPSGPTGGNGGQGPHWNPPPPPPNTPPPGWTPNIDDTMDLISVPIDDTGVTSTSDIIDVAAEQDAEDDALAIAQANLADQNLPATSEPYVPDWGDNYVNVSQVGGGPNSPGSLLYGINLEDYFGEGANSLEFLPQNFLQSLMEGTVVGEYENIITNNLIESGENWASGDAPDVIMDPNTGEMVSVVGTWDMIENPEVYGEHPIFPGGLDDYYDMMGENWGTPNAPSPGGGGWEDYGDYFGDQRRAKLDFLNALAGGAPAKDLQQSGFFDELVPQYHPDEARKVLEEGIFSGMSPGYTGEGMKRILRSYGSGLQSPRYENVARGGIMGPWNNMRR